MTSVINTQNRLSQSRLDSSYGSDGKIMRPTQPLAYLRFFLPKHLSKVFLSEEIKSPKVPIFNNFS